MVWLRLQASAQPGPNGYAFFYPVLSLCDLLFKIWLCDFDKTLAEACRTGRVLFLLLQI